MVDRCEPPLEHQDKREHTLSAEGETPDDADRIPFRAEWVGGMWKMPQAFPISPEKAERCGFRYVAPC